MYQAKDYGVAREQLATAFFDVGAVLTRESNHPLVVERDGPSGKERGFRLKLHERLPEAPLSPIYLNLRTPDNPKSGPLTPEVVELAANCLHLLIYQRPSIRFDAIAGIPNAGTPIAEAFARQAEQYRLPGQRLFRLGKEEGYGKRRIVLPDGSANKTIPAGGIILAIDDLVSEADSKIEAARAIKSGGYRVRDVAVLVDRQQGGEIELSRQGYALHSVFMISELLDMAVRINRISQPLAQEIRQYLKLAA